MLLFLWGVSFAVAMGGLVAAIYFSHKVEVATKNVNRSYSRIIVTLVDMIEVYASMIETLDTHNMVPAKHSLPKNLADLREEHKRVAAG